MAASSHGPNDTIPFGFEERLQELIAATPGLLASPRWPGNRLLLGREIPAYGQQDIEDGPLSERKARERPGWMDVCFVEADGIPTIVETKLDTNGSMKTVLQQALAYANALFVDSERAARIMRKTLGSVAARFPATPGVWRLVEKVFPGWNPNTVHERIRQHISEKRCRIVIAADAIWPEVVWDAARLRPTLGNISMDLINVRRTPGGPRYRRLEMDPAAYERGYRHPNGAVEWEEVKRIPIEATAFQREMVKDRFYSEKDGYRITRTGSLPAILYYEAAPGRAPVGDLHQVERSRREGCAPVMPNLGLLSRPDHNNPYPTTGKTISVVTDPKYRGIVAICHATWEFLKEHGSIDLQIDDAKLVQREIVRRSGVTLSKLAPEVAWVALTAPYDAMPDCALYGLVRHSRRRHGEHRFEMRDLPTNFATVPF